MQDLHVHTKAYFQTLLDNESMLDDVEIQEDVLLILQGERHIHARIKNNM